MKAKIFSILLFFAALSYQASAFKVVIRGGTASHTYYQIIITSNLMSCTGNGHNPCPFFSNNDGSTKATGIPLVAISDYIMSEIDNGNKVGNVDFMGKLPCTWKVNDDESIEIEFQDDVVGLEKQ